MVGYSGPAARSEQTTCAACHDVNQPVTGMYRLRQRGWPDTADFCSNMPPKCCYSQRNDDNIVKSKNMGVQLSRFPRPLGLKKISLQNGRTNQTQGSQGLDRRFQNPPKSITTKFVQVGLKHLNKMRAVA